MIGKCEAYFRLHDAVQLARQKSSVPIPKSARVEIGERSHPVHFTSAKAATKKNAVHPDDDLVEFHKPYDAAALDQAKTVGYVAHIYFSKPGSGGDAGPPKEGDEGLLNVVTVWVGNGKAGPKVLHG